MLHFSAKALPESQQINACVLLKMHVFRCRGRQLKFRKSPLRGVLGVDLHVLEALTSVQPHFFLEFHLQAILNLPAPVDLN